jgi:hypothetical protein
MSAAIFVGPSLAGASTGTALGDFRRRPPAQRGDLYRAVCQGVRVIGLIDGYFHTVPSVLHKEILWALHQGCAVYGAASLGALRAAELHGYGMAGVGAIFADFRDGRLWRDDEVALSHGPAELGFPPLSEPLVNIRATLAHAVAAQRIDAARAGELIAAAAGLFYADRSLEAAARVHRAAKPATALSPEELRWLIDHRVDQKAADAREMLTVMRGDLERGSLPVPPPFAFEDTAFFARFRGLLDNPLTRDLA